MANADFSQKQNSTSGGFDAGSYREQKQPEQAVPLTPLQQKLAGLEAKLPAALSTRAAALALSVVVMLAAFLGFGSAKLHSRYNEVRKWYTVGVAADNGYNLNEELTTRMNTAANIITTAGSTLGADSAEVQAAQSALSDFTACLEAVQNGGKSQALTSLPYYQGSTMHALYQANEVLVADRSALRKAAGAGRRPHEDGRGAGPVRPVQQCGYHHRHPEIQRCRLRLPERDRRLPGQRAGSHCRCKGG